MIEMEKWRLEFTKEMEFQRLNMFVEAQLQIEKMNQRAKMSSSVALFIIFSVRLTYPLREGKKFEDWLRKMSQRV